MERNGTAAAGPKLATRRPMKRGDIAFYVGVAVTALTTLAHPGGLLSSFVVGTFSGGLAVGIVMLILSRR